MEPRITLITLGVADVPRSISFYRDGLGFPVSSMCSDEMAWFKLGNGLVLGIWSRSLLAEDAGVPDQPTGFSGITLAHNVRERDEVDATLEHAERAGATITKPAHDAFWGGRTGYFKDPDGHLWEVAWNPGNPVGADGNMELV